MHATLYANEHACFRSRRFTPGGSLDYQLGRLGYIRIERCARVLRAQWAAREFARGICGYAAKGGGPAGDAGQRAVAVPWVNVHAEVEEQTSTDLTR